jgi:excinuclease ABC subunit C
VERVAEFLRTSGKTMLQTAEAARTRLSADMEFEAAGLEHKRVERIESVLKLRDELARETNSLHGVAVTTGRESGVVKLWFVNAGVWQQPIAIALADGAESRSLDRRLKDLVAALPEPVPVPAKARQEHLAILARWFYSSWRDGEWVEFDSLERISYRRLVNAVSRVVHHSPPSASH